MTKTHWKKLCNLDYIGAYALEPNEEKILTIKEVKREIVIGQNGKKEECSVAHFVEKEKPMILNRTNQKTIQKIYKTPYIEEWAGRKIQIYADMVKFGGELVEALRIRPNIPKQADLPADKPIPCADCGQVIAAFGGMTAAQMAKYTYDKYGKSLCSQCATEEAGKVKDKEAEDVL